MPTSKHQDAHQTLTVSLGQRSYPIHIGSGLIKRLPKLLGDELKNRPVFILTDSVVGPLYADKVVKALDGYAQIRDCMTIPAGEGSKSLAQFGQVLSRFLERGLTRDAIIIALGGGVIGDLAGFVAGTILRGVRFIQIPTTLLAQVDSSVGGKTGVNTQQGKNLVGVFHQPIAVLCDLDVLQSLPNRDFASGMAEVVKYGLIADNEFFAWLEANIAAVRARESAALTHIIHTSCAIKAAIVAEDEHETGTARMTLNFGHTFGHALEAAAGYGDRLTHGEAVGLGMLMACKLSERKTKLSHAVFARTETLLSSFDLPVSPIERVAATPDELLSLMAQDKKAVADGIRFILLETIGKTRIVKLAGDDMQTVKQVLAEAA
jgi:3-dehydroquinate synthase